MQNKYTPVLFDSVYRNETQTNRCERLLREHVLKSHSRLSVLSQNTAPYSSEYESTIALQTNHDDIKKIKMLSQAFRGIDYCDFYNGYEDTLIELLARVNWTFDAPQDEENKRQLHLLLNKNHDYNIMRHILKYLLTVTVCATFVVFNFFFLPPLVLAVSGLTASLGLIYVFNEGKNAQLLYDLKDIQQSINTISFFAPKPPGPGASMTICAPAEIRYPS